MRLPFPGEAPLRRTMTSTLLIGIIAAFVATTLAAALRRAPTRARCPQCGEATVSVQPEAWLLKRMPDLRMRWCQACSWQGWGRNGVEWIPGHPAAHDSGFHWGDERFPEDWGFRFARQEPAETAAEPPHHPSGFRFSAPPRTGPAAAHPSGFSWADGQGNSQETSANGRPGPGRPGEPPGFRWAASPPSEGRARFEWGRRVGQQGPPPKGFSWKDVV